MWSFDQPPNCATMMSKSVVEDGHPILFVSHDEEDHAWQFLDGTNPPSDPVLVCLSHAIGMDPSVVQLADLPPGWIAWREGSHAEWVREPFVDGES